MKARKLIAAVVLLGVTSLGCTGTTANSPAGTARLTAATQEIKACHGDPPTLPCHHVDLGK